MNGSPGRLSAFRAVKPATAGRSGAQPKASTERARIAPAGLGLDGHEPHTLPAAPGGSETHPRRMPRGERWSDNDVPHGHRSARGRLAYAVQHGERIWKRWSGRVWLNC